MSGSLTGGFQHEPTRVRETPLKAHIIPKLDHDIAADLGAVSAPTPRKRQTRNLVIGQLLLLAWSDLDAWLRYSRDRSAYTSLVRYHRGRISYDLVTWSVQTLVEAGLATERRSAPGACCAWQSRLRATGRLIADAPLQTVDYLEFRPVELIRLKDDAGMLVDYIDTPEMQARRQDIAEQNEAMRSIKLRLDGGGWTADAHGIYRCGTRVLLPIADQLHSVFNGDWRRGGRLYGPSWQGLSSTDRSRITLSGATTTEPDFESFHPTLLSAIAGVGWGGGDPYDVCGFERKLCKLGFNTLLNADSTHAAVLAIADASRRRGLDQPHSLAKRLVQAIAHRHPQFAGYWGKGVGLRLQRIDSQICLNVLRSIRRAGEVGLPVHDSFIVRRDASSLAQSVMADALGQTLREIRLGKVSV
jgi:hypothetical protein